MKSINIIKLWIINRIKNQWAPSKIKPKIKNVEKKPALMKTPKMECQKGGSDGQCSLSAWQGKSLERRGSGHVCGGLSWLCSLMWEGTFIVRGSFPGRGSWTVQNGMLWHACVHACVHARIHCTLLLDYWRQAEQLLPSQPWCAFCTSNCEPK